MPCYHPIPAWQPPNGGPVKLWPPVGTATLKLPCGGCLGCKTTHALGWARRSQYEASSWDNNCFVTLTYDDEHLPYGGYLEPADLQKFIKRLRRAHDRREATIATDHHFGIRYVASGEYGEKNGRPHYHLLLFNCAFTDAKAVGKDVTESPTLSKYWKKGQHRIGALTGASANYVAQYTLKKQVTPGGGLVTDADGVIIEQPFLRCSLKPAIGQRWTEKYYADLRNGYLIVDARKEKIPRAMRKQLAKIDPLTADEAAIAIAKLKKAPQSKERLEAAERIHQQRAALTQQRNL